jgi:hypothetical protein
MRVALALLLTHLASPALAAPQTFGCAFDETNRAGGEPRAAATEFVLDADAQTIEFHAPGGNWTFDNAADLGHRIKIGESEGNYSGAGKADGRTFTFTFKQPTAEAGAWALAWAVFGDGPEGGRSAWRCAPAGQPIPAPVSSPSGSGHANLISPPALPKA